MADGNECDTIHLMIYDCFSFFNELDLLEIRLNVLKDVVDRFVIVEAGRFWRGIARSDALSKSGWLPDVG